MNLQASWISAKAAGILKRQSPFRVKAAFQHVINLVSEGEIIAVQTPQVPLTPIALRVREQDFADLSIALRRGQINLTVTGPPPADCSLPPSDARPADRWLFQVRKLLSTLAPADSFAFITDPLWTARSKPTVLQLRAREILEQADGQLSARDFPAAARTLQSLKGLGPGLTPAGDDFLIGILAACTRFPHRGMDSLGKELGKAVTANPDSSTWLSAALLACAAEGAFSLSIHTILTAPDDTALVRGVSAGIAWGHTSGADTLGGIFWALQTAASHK